MSNTTPLLLVIDDEPSVLGIITRTAQAEGFAVVACSTGEEGIATAGKRRPDLVLVDMRMPGVDGLDVVRALRKADPTAMVVLMTGHASIDSAVEAVKLGAADYLTKPFNLARLRQTFSAVREEAERRARLLEADGELARHTEFAGMIGHGAAMREVFDLIRRLAPHIRTGLITGETGTGKELVARALHTTGPRRARKFSAVNCSAVVETLFESELFGYVRGAFTGATENKPGLFQATDGGTLFLDEIGELPLAMQAKLLRVVESGEVQRVGSLQTEKTDVRVVGATNRDLEEEVAAGRFRRDLLYRLNVVQIRLPPLRERREDIALMTAAFVREFGRRFSKPITGLTLEAQQVLVGAPWPGNVRQLRNVLERACMLAVATVITDRDIEVSLGEPRRAAESPAAETERATAQGTDALANVEIQHIVKMLEEAGGNKTDAARRLGVSRRALYRRLARHGLAKKDERDRDRDGVTDVDRLPDIAS